MPPPPSNPIMSELYTLWNSGRRERFDALAERSEPWPSASEVDRNGRTALWLAAAVGSFKGVELSLKKGHALEHRAPARGFTPLHAATFWNHPEVLRLLLFRGAQVNARDEFGQSSLMLAVLSGSPPLTETLLTAGAHVDAQDANGRTALMMAAGRRRTLLVRRLLEAGAEVNLQDETGATALMVAANVAIARLLLEAGSDAALMDGEGRTARDRFQRRPSLLALLGTPGKRMK